jgi:magnesium-transporting ATPase (P-type)
LEAGDRIPADARLVESHSLQCDEAPLTGESMAVTKDAAPVPEGASLGHIRPVMITGDHKLTGVAVARELDIYREGDLVLTGELTNMDDHALADVVERVTVYARVSPMDKLKS